MKIVLGFLTDWKFWSFGIGGISLILSIINYIIRKVVITKIVENDLKHLKIDVDNLKNEESKYKINLREDLAKIYRRLGHIEKSQGIQKAICDERHKDLKDK